MMLKINNPLYQNLLAAIATVVYVKVVIGGCDLAVSKQILNAHISRKIIHIAAASWLIFWKFFNADHWSWQLNILVPAVYAVQLFVKGAIIQDPNDPDVKTMSRSGKPIELCYGPFVFTIIMCYCGIFAYQQDEAIYIMSALGYGDGIAPLAGRFVPFMPYATYPFTGKDYKTVSGSVAFFISSILGLYILRYILGFPVSIDIFHAMKIFAVVTVVEGVTGYMDNPFIAITAALLHRNLM